ncbi:MAG: DUF4097 family beta strand repeat-containing protein [Phycisphaerales bacterium]
MCTSSLYACLAICLAGIAGPNPSNAIQGTTETGAALGTALSQSASGEERVPIREFALSFADPSKAGHLDIDIKRGDILVTAHDSDEVLVRLSVPKAKTPVHADRAPGLQTISARPLDFNVRQNGNTIELDGNSYDAITHIEVLVPRHTDLTLDSYRSGEIRVDGVRGHVNARSQNNTITLTKITGSARIIGRNGDISASFHQVTGAVTIETYNGNIDLAIPADTKTTALIRAVKGNVQSQLSIVERPARLVIANPKDGTRSFELGEYFIGDINGGGVQSVLETTNGSVRIRKYDAPATDVRPLSFD